MIKFKSSKSYWSVSYFILLFTIREAIAWKFGSAIKVFSKVQAEDSSFPLLWEVIGVVFNEGSLELVLIFTLIFLVLSLTRVTTNTFSEIEKETNKLEKKKIKGTREEQKRAKEQLAYLEGKNVFYSDLGFKAEFTKKIVKNMIDNLIAPYQNIIQSIRTLKIQNWLYSLLLVILFYILMVYADDLMLHKNNLLQAILDDENKDISFGVLLGIILYHSTPILFISSIFIYVINQINKNLRIIESLRERRESIDLLESTLYAQIEMGVSDQEVIENIKALSSTLQVNSLELILGRENNLKEKIDKDTIKKTYRERMIQKGLDTFLKQLTKIK